MISAISAGLTWAVLVALAGTGCILVWAVRALARANATAAQAIQAGPRPARRHRDDTPAGNAWDDGYAIKPGERDRQPERRERGTLAKAARAVAVFGGPLGTWYLLGFRTTVLAGISAGVVLILAAWLTRQRRGR